MYSNISFCQSLGVRNKIRLLTTKSIHIVPFFFNKLKSRRGNKVLVLEKEKHCLFDHGTTTKLSQMC